VDYLLTASLSLALLVAVLVLLRERRLRLALQHLVYRLLNMWRTDLGATGVDRTPDHRAAARVAVSHGIRTRARQRLSVGPA
jgi:hypothetical protein